MVEILNTDIPKNKKLFKSLTTIFGINNNTAKVICRTIGLNPEIKVSNLNQEQQLFLKKYIEKVYKNKAGFALRKEIYSNIENLVTMKSYRGARHKYNLPVRGQRTRTNARTQKKTNMHRIRGGGNTQ